MPKSRLKVRGLRTVIQRMRRAERNVNTAVAVGTEASANVIAQTARAMAPLDEGPLEEAIKYTFRKTPAGYRAEIFVDPTAETVQSGKTVSVFAYAEYQHENLVVGGGETAAGSGKLNLGPRSREKQEHSAPGIDVGGKFMDRALELRGQPLVSEMDKAVRQAVRSDRRPNAARLTGFNNLVRNLLGNRI